MLNQLLDLLLYFKNTHPIRFWALVSFIFLLCIGGLLLLRNYKFQAKLKAGKKKPGKKKTRKMNSWKPVIVIAILFGVIGMGTSYLYINYRGKSYNTIVPAGENTHLTANKKGFGIDISHYQGNIDWEALQSSEHCINYIFIRATMGSNGIDYQFQNNWKNSGENKFLRGAYHYYRPNANSTEQFKNFSSIVKLGPGDFPPVLDIEEMGKYGTENLVAGVLNWLKMAEEHYGVIPIVYTGSNFYELYLKGRIDNYPLWIAAYSGSERIRNVEWKFHQFSDRIRIKGIDEYVDGNSFNGENEDLLRLLIGS